MSELTSQRIAGFAVYGTLRDDDNSGATWTAEFLSGVRRETIRTAHVKGFKMYMNKVHNWPYALRTGAETDYIVVRYLEFPDEVHVSKLKYADDIENYDPEGLKITHAAVECRYERTVVNPIPVVTGDGSKSEITDATTLQAYMYYVNSLDPAHEWREVTGNDWLAREF